MTPEERVEMLKKNADTIKNMDENQMKFVRDQVVNNRGMMKQMM